MSGEVVETYLGRRHTYEIRAVRTRVCTTFAIYRNGSRWRGEYATLSRAIEVLREAD